MKRNAAFYRALQLLIHPVSVTAILVVLINDHVLRRLWPSWMTGKIGDLAWLVFAPFVLAALLAWVTPRAVAAHPNRLGGLAIALVGVHFALAKTVPFFHMLTVRAIEIATA
jgi:hypothetical protein